MVATSHAREEAAIKGVRHGFYNSARQRLTCSLKLQQKTL